MDPDVEDGLGRPVDDTQDPDFERWKPVISVKFAYVPEARVLPGGYASSLSLPSVAIQGILTSVLAIVHSLLSLFCSLTIPAFKRVKQHCDYHGQK
ncbi:hypothetical protein GCM10009751_30890 [Myceligenerans crystallogenes]|uniref:Uncharacterized protein n=1 Tax=Myceligenerans crystallogenes TaxID=316335 RepID=A0ABN2NIV2_9MICO